MLFDDRSDIGSLNESMDEQQSIFDERELDDTHSRMYNRMAITLPKTSLRDQYPKDNMKWISGVVRELRAYATKGQRKITWMDSAALADALER